MIRVEIDHFIMNRVCLMYKIMRIKSKISFYAFIRRQTIQEYIVCQILCTFTALCSEKQDLSWVQDTYEIFKSFHFGSYRSSFAFMILINQRLREHAREKLTIHDHKLCQIVQERFTVKESIKVIKQGIEQEVIIDSNQE